MNDDKGEWFTTRQAAAYSKKGVSSIRKALENGSLHGHKGTGHWRIWSGSVDALVKGRDTKAPCCASVVPMRRRSA